MGNIRNFHFLLPTFLSFTFGVLLVLCLGFGPVFTKLSQNSFDLQGKIWSLHFCVLFMFSVLCVAQSLGNGTVLMSCHEKNYVFQNPHYTLLTYVCVISLRFPSNQSLSNDDCWIKKTDHSSAAYLQSILMQNLYAMLTTFPQCNFTEIPDHTLSNSDPIIDWLHWVNTKWCIMGILLTCPIFYLIPSNLLCVVMGYIIIDGGFFYYRF